MFLGRKIQVETHIALYSLLLRRFVFFFADTGINVNLLSFSIVFPKGALWERYYCEGVY